MNRTRRTGWKHSEETKAKISAGNRGKKHSPETKALNSLRHKGKTISEETRRKMSATHLRIAKYGHEHPRWRGGDTESNAFKRLKKCISRDEVSKWISKRDGGNCQICGRISLGNGTGKKLHLDHDHKTHKIRGILCGRCNTGLGLFDDSPELLQSAINYLNAYLCLAPAITDQIQ